MKKDIHPSYFKESVIKCACGNTLTTGSTLESINVEICSKCHPFFTGKQRLVDTARRVEKFAEKLAKKDQAATERKGRKVKRARKTASKKTKSSEK